MVDDDDYLVILIGAFGKYQFKLLPSITAASVGWNLESGIWSLESGRTGTLKTARSESNGRSGDPETDIYREQIAIRGRRTKFMRCDALLHCAAEHQIQHSGSGRGTKLYYVLLWVLQVPAPD